MRKWPITMFTLWMIAGGTAWAAEAEKAASGDGLRAFTWLIVTAGFALAIAASIGAISQSRALVSACEGISRNPGSADAIRGLLILGLAFIESLVIYVLFVDILLLFGIGLAGRLPIGG
ncbi:MAG: ATP synthase F0 subunit C [Acidobacteria bacterium]|nr:ATP synthase F0 subunit C [Acidobacteriota bacterium]MDW7984273.1 ATP synthase F0 subunit C [Acidobacteriota bacterium]